MFKKKEFLKIKGNCTICDQKVTFTAKNNWLRDHLLCSLCGSIPRERALMAVVKQFFPDWKKLIIHESSPVFRGASASFLKECSNYIPSQFIPFKQAGSLIDGCRNENLEKLTFDNQSIDLHISQDVFEHIFDPAQGFKEIARTLKPGGAHIFTVPLVNKERPSEIRAMMKSDGHIEYIKPASYHDNPVSNEGSLVTFDWGFDITHYIHKACNLFTSIIYIDDLSRGISAEYIEVLVTWKNTSISSFPVSSSQF
jgi:SAM-dependent methyltransferase